MPNIELCKINAYAAVNLRDNAGQIQITKTNGYGVALNVPGHMLLSKTNSYGVALNVPGHELLAKVNAYGVVNDELGIQGTQPRFAQLNESEIFVPELESSILPKFELREMERNPYRPHVAEREEDRLADAREQQRIIRQQHNITQAGDTTFDYGLLLRGYPNEEFTLGSLGRFFHDDFGLILARFVRFSDFVDDEIQGQPVGRLRFNNSEGVNWTVTNDISKSSAALAFGFVFLATTPVDGTYGWAVVSGPNPAQVRNLTSEIPTQNAPYVWAGTGAIRLGGSGRILARKWGTSRRAGLPAGSLFIQPESDTILDVVNQVRDSLEELQEISEIWENLDASDERSRRALANSIEAKSDVVILNTYLQSQIDRLGELIAAIGSPTDWLTVIQQGDASVMNALAAATTEIHQTINNLILRVKSIEDQLSLYSLSDMYENLQGIIGFIENANELFNQIMMPVVDGSIPPTFIQNPDGNLVYVRIS